MLVYVSLSWFKYWFLTYVTSSGLDSEDTALNVQERHIEGASAEVVDQNVALLVGLASTETVSDSSGGGLVDDTEDVEASDGTGVLGGLPLVVVEVGGDGDDGLLNLLGKLGLGNLLHLDKDHGGDLLGGEGLLLAEVLDGDLRAAVVVDNLERPGLDVLLDGGVIESAANETPGRLSEVVLVCASCFPTHLTSKTVLTGFMAAWFLAASPIRRSSAVKETKDGVVKAPWSLATGRWHCQRRLARVRGTVVVHTDLNAIALVVGNARVGGA
jgi:hypothetical protein